VKILLVINCKLYLFRVLVNLAFACLADIFICNFYEHVIYSQMLSGSMCCILICFMHF
jgi:hypothetical protein